MTATMLGAAPAPARRRVPWRRLGWVAWRRYRTSIAATLALLVLVAIYVLIRGQQMRTAYAAVQACTPHASASCRFRFETFHETYGNPGPAGAVLVWVPALIGAFAGAPLLAREMETGTFRYAWTQGVGRMRWLAGLLVPGVAGVAALGAAVGALVAWYEQPLVASGIQQRLHGSLFPVTGVAIVGWSLLGYALGILAGLVIRRAVPALATTLVVWTGLAFAASSLRLNYEAPLVTRRLELPNTYLPVQQWWSHDGVRVGQAQIDHVLQAIGVQSMNGGADFQVGPGGGSVDPVQYLLQHGYTQWTSYQPDARFWTFQWIEFGWLAALSVLLLAAAVWLVRRRGA